MPKTEWMRERLAEVPSPELLAERLAAGWRPAAIEWERESREPSPELPILHEVPFGLRVSAEGGHLEEEPREMKVLEVMLALIVSDEPLSRVAEELNRQGLRRRDGATWGPTSVFDLLPRLIDVAPSFLRDGDWPLRKARLSSSV